MRYKITIEYDGAPYLGFQFQENGKSVQGCLEAAVFALSQEKTRVHAAGRTDAGVHAKAQVAHFDIVREFDAKTLKNALNFYLRNEEIVISAAEIVDENFHARFSAKKRQYRYIILNRDYRAVLDRKRVWWMPHPLDVKKMNEAAKMLIGKHDFSSFRAAECQAKSPIKTLDEAHFEQNGDFIIFSTSATSFLHNQVRAMVGSLSLVGRGKWTIEDFKAAFMAKDRTKGGPNAPPSGLYFWAVDY